MGDSRLLTSRGKEKAPFCINVNVNFESLANKEKKKSLSQKIFSTRYRIILHLISFCFPCVPWNCWCQHAEQQAMHKILL